MSIPTAAPETTIYSSLWNALAGLVNGTVGFGQPVSLTDYSSAINPSLSVRNQNTSGQPFRVYNGSLDLIAAYNTGANSGYVTIAGLVDKGGQWFNVKAYGAVGNGSTDDTSAIQAAISAALAAQAAVGGNSSGAIVYFPPGDYAVSSLNMTGCSGIIFFGSLVTITASKQTVARPVFDCVGSSNSRWIGFNISCSTTAPTLPLVSPSCAILLAPTTGGGNSTKNFFEHVGAAGRFTAATVYQYASTDHTFIHCAFQNFAQAPVYWATKANSASVTSAGTIYTLAAADTGESTWIQPELHSMCYAVSLAGQPAVKISEAGGIRFYGGVIATSNGSLAYVNFTAGLAEAILFDGVRFYPDDPNTIPSNIFYTSGAITVSNLQVIAPSYVAAIGSSSSYAVYRGEANSVLEYSHIECGAISSANNPNTWALYMEDATSAATETVKESRFYCSGENVRMGASVGAGSKFINPGTFTWTGAATDKSDHLNTDGSWLIGAGLRGDRQPTTGAIRLPRGAEIHSWGSTAANARVIGLDGSDIINNGQSTVITGVLVNAANTVNLAVAGNNKIRCNASGVGFNGVDGVAAPNFTITNATADRLTLDQTSATATEVREVVGTIVKYLIANGLFQ